MPKIEIDKERCKGCQLCIVYCPRECIKADTSMNRKGVQSILFDKDKKCTGCSFCAVICPDLCITVYK